MKKSYIILTAALCFAACSKEAQIPEFDGTESSLTAFNENTRTSLDNYSVIWTAGDAINLFSKTGVEYASNKFTTEEGGSSSVTFKGDGGIAVDANAYVFYPYDEKATFDGTKIATKISTISQKVAPDTFVEGLNITMGQCTKDRTATFKSIGTLLKFTLLQDGADSLRCIEIRSNGGEPIAVEGDVNIDWNDGEPKVVPATGATTSDVITLTAKKGAFEKDSTYYVWLLPGEYSSGITLKLFSPTLMEGVKKGSSALSAVRNQIVNLEQIKDLTIQKAIRDTKVLEFDFTTEAQTGWPTKDKWCKVEVAPLPDTTCVYTMTGGEKYDFVLSACRAAVDGRIAWTSTGLTLYAAQRFLGLPVIKDYRLAEVHCVQGTSPKNSRKAAICDKVTEVTGEAYSCVDGNEPMGGMSQLWDVVNAHYYLRTTLPDTMYYLTCTTGGIGCHKITLVYVK